MALNNSIFCRSAVNNLKYELFLNNPTFVYFFGDRTPCHIISGYCRYLLAVTLTFSSPYACSLVYLYSSLVIGTMVAD